MTTKEAIEWIEQMRDHCWREIGEDPDLTEASRMAIASLRREQVEGELLEAAKGVIWARNIPPFSPDQIEDKNRTWKALEKAIANAEPAKEGKR
jgi:hypothetical protein